MRRVLGWATVAVLFCATGAAAQDAGMDARLVEAQTAFDEAKNLLDAGKYAAGIPPGEHALALREAVLGGTHPEVANCLNLVGELYWRQGHLARAETLLQRGLALREAALGKDHPDVAASLSNLAELYQLQGLSSRAEALCRRALAIREAALGENHPDVASSLNILASIYVAQRSTRSLAEPLAQRALVIWEAALGKNHPSVAAALSTLAGMYPVSSLTGLGISTDGRAEPLLLRALAIYEAALGKNHPSVAPVLLALGELYHAQGAYGRVEPLIQRALSISEAALGKDHLFVAYSLNNLAQLRAIQRLYDQAAPPMERAVAILEATFGKNHLLVGHEITGLANVYIAQGLYAPAEKLLRRALSICEAALGKSDPALGRLLLNLADLYLAQGMYDQAEPFFQRVLAIWDVPPNPNNGFVGLILNDLARLRLAQHRLAEAVPLFTRAFTISETDLRTEALDLSESRLASLLQRVRSDEESLYAVLRTHPGDPSVRRLALTAALLRKGRSVEEMADTSRTIYRSLGAQDRDTFERLRGLRTQLAKLSLDGGGEHTSADDSQRLKDLVDQGDALEADLAKRSAPLRALTALPSPADIVNRVAAALPRNAALVELITYADNPLVAKPGMPRAKFPSQLRYLALVLFPDGHTRALDLGPAAPIDSAALRLRDALASRDAAYQGAAQRLYQLAFQPLLPLLGEVRRLFIAPDGQLGLVPFAVLHDGRRFLVDSFDFTYLTSGKDLLPRPEDIPPARSVVVLADPDFGTAPAAPPPPPNGAATLAERSSSVERFFSTLRADVADRPWVQLPGTRQEAAALQALMPQAQLFLGPDATKARLLHLEAPGILHVATHGFFIEDADASPGTRSLGASGPLGGEGLAQRPPDPLLRSGLVLAGARAPAAKAGEPSTRHLDESLVTALELAGLNLWGTELVVLSACDTGRGDVKLGQGVYGLRRALVIAGAETLVMSLWKVNDETTRTLMETYYRNLLAGWGRVTALREAMLALREQQPHPHFWAPFIALGRDAPLRGIASPLP